MRRLRAFGLLVLTAFFAVAGAYHQHRLSRPSADHVGLCSDTSAVSSLELCAICQATHTAAEWPVVAAVASGLDQTSRLTVARAIAPTPINASLLHDDRAPPSV